MKADPAVQRQLLDLQTVDTVVAQRTHRRRTLPELAIIEAATARLAALGDDVIRAQTAIGDLDREQKRLEADVEQVRSRSARDETRLTSGQFSNPKELQSLQQEVQSLARRQGDLEEQVLEVMEQRETADAGLADVRRTAAEVETELAGAQQRRDAAFAEIDAELTQRQAERAVMLGGLPADLIALYERIRAQLGGTGAAMLRHRRCEGCRMELASTDLSKARTTAAEEVLRCEDCGRILVRTAESGL
ncbi:MAG: C4-type zinc ribbon domain-containing protein [Actinomycetota bacterium]|nr:C4-type zinc ribbon domain-containing protein [Actinomycetota bacterium]